MRNFTYHDVNTLNICPFLPYHDPAKKFVNLWNASTEGPIVETFNKKISPCQINKLEEEGGLCIMYTHLGNGFSRNGRLNSEFKARMEYLSKKNCWFAPVSEVLDYIIKVRGKHVISPKERNILEMRWLKERLFLGST